MQFSSWKCSCSYVSFKTILIFWSIFTLQGPPIWSMFNQTQISADVPFVWCPSRSVSRPFSSYLCVFADFPIIHSVIIFQIEFLYLLHRTVSFKYHKYCSANHFPVCGCLVWYCHFIINDVIFSWLLLSLWYYHYISLPLWYYHYHYHCDIVIIIIIIATTGIMFLSFIFILSQATSNPNAKQICTQKIAFFIFN